MTAQHPLSVIISDRRRRAAFCLTAARVALCGASAGGEGVSVPPPIGGDHDRVGAAVSGGGARAGEGAPGSRATGATAAVSFSSEEAGIGTPAAAPVPVPASSEPKEIHRSRAHLRDRCCNLAIKSWCRGRIKSGIVAGATAPALGLAQ